MAFEQRDNSGSIFRNDKKTQEMQPDGTGSAMIDGVEYWVSSWNKTSSTGNSFRSLSFTKKEQQPKQVAPKKATGGGSRQTPSDDFDNCPF